MRLALLLALLWQGQALQVTTALERSRVAVGEDVLFTLRAVGHSTAPFRVELPGLDGLALVERTERTDVVVGTGQTTRAYTLELRLRAEQVGTWVIGPIRVEQGEASAFSVVDTVRVVSGTSGAASGLEPDLMALIPRVPAPRLGEPSVFTLASDERVFAGDQVNVLTGAWLPRALRLRLRQAPTLTPPALAGVWSTPRPAVPGAVASRQVGDETYDLYVSFQTVYPLNPGSLTIPPARLAWDQPSGRQYLGPTRRESAESAPLTLLVRPLSDAGRPVGFDGPVAHDLRIEYQLGASSGRAGAVLPVAVVVIGAGNLPLWPPPRIAWPASVRVYQEGTETAPRLTGLRMGGNKKFKFGVVPDSAGSLSLPALEYAYFDPASASYRSARAPAIVVPVLEAAPVAEHRNPLPIEEPGSPSLVERLDDLSPLGGFALVLAPLLLMAGSSLWRRRRPLVLRPPQRSPTQDLETLVKTLVPPGTPAVSRKRVAALRAAGVQRLDAERLVRLHLALEADRFAPNGSGGANPPLLREIEHTLHQLPAKIRRTGGLTAGILVFLLVLPRSAAAQSGADYYARGEYDEAAHAFGTEVVTFPFSTARWYNLATAEYLAHRDAQAVVALLPARAHAPRDPHVKALWNALAREHEELRRAGRNWPLSAEECFGLALIAWWLAAVLFALAGRWRSLWATLFGLALVFGVAGVVRVEQRAGPLAVLAGGASLRTSPHGLAPERGTVAAFSIVRLERQLGNWWLIQTVDGAEGWVPEEILARTGALD